MNDQIVNSNCGFLSEDWQVWLLLRHLLPARLQRLLIHEIVHIATGGRISFGDLFEEVLVDRPVWNESWMIRPREGKRGYEESLQSWARGIAWQLDETGRFASAESEESGKFLSGAFLDIIAALGAMDLNSPKDWANRQLKPFTPDVQPSMQTFVSVFESIQLQWTESAPDVFWKDVSGRLEILAMPVRAMVLKHFADLLADVDAWKHALHGYCRVEDLLAQWSAPEHHLDLLSAWKTITMQCRIAATAVVEGDNKAAILFDEVLVHTNLDADPLLAANAGLDAINSRSWIEHREFKDLRVSVVSSPLLHSSHDATSALRFWLDSAHREAGRPFWAALRRQIALGAATEMENTKGWYARCLLEEIAGNSDQQASERQFELAVRLLVEAGKPKAVDLVRWSSSLVDACVVDEGLVDRLLARASAHAGCCLQRMRVLVELFKVWAIQLSPSRPDLTLRMWKELASIAGEFDATFDSKTDVGRPALKAIEELAKKRPELRGKVGPKVAEAICRSLRRASAWGRSEAADAALCYVDALDEGSLRMVAYVVLDVLEAGDPARNAWPLDRAAMRVIVDPTVRHRLGSDREFNQRCLEQILRYGLAEETSPMSVFFHLADFDPSLLENETLKARMKETLIRVRKGALRSNASEVTGHIEALLLAPVVAGHDGIGDALDGLLLILRSTKAESSSLGIAHFDRTLLLLVERLPSIRAALPEQQDWLNQKLASIADHVAAFWDLAKENPLLFSPFSIPARTRPDRVLVHNCAFASVRFAQAVGKERQIRESIGRAGENPALKSAILLAHATLAGGKKPAPEDIEVAENEDRDSFYQSVGRRLRQVQQMPEDEAGRICLQLVERCLHLGPNPADAAVFVAAANLGLHQQVRSLGLGNYVTRAGEDRDTRLLLIPIVELFTDSRVGITASGD
jgi:hypothetical protein